MAEFTAIFLWGLSFWFFCFTLVSILACARAIKFRLNWWAYIFPNVGFTIATTRIGMQLDSPAIEWVSSGMTIALMATWVFVLAMHARAVLRKTIMMPGRDEDAH